MRPGDYIVIGIVFVITFLDYVFCLFNKALKWLIESTMELVYGAAEWVCNWILVALSYLVSDDFTMCYMEESRDKDWCYYDLLNKAQKEYERRAKHRWR